MSPDLIAFLKAWHDWATSGAPDKGPFLRCDGLCDNVWRLYGSTSHRSEVVRDELFALFGHKIWPFGYDEYHERDGADTQHECPKRLAWVRERLVEAGEIVETLK